MIINDQNFKSLNDLLENIEIEKFKDEKQRMRIEAVRIKLQQLSREGGSVKRSGNEKRIAEFNRIFIKSLAELSRITQTTGNANRDEVAKIVRSIKAQ